MNVYKIVVNVKSGDTLVTRSHTVLTTNCNAAIDAIKNHYSDKNIVDITYAERIGTNVIIPNY